MEYIIPVNDIEHLKMLDLENQLKFARKENKKLREEVDRLNILLCQSSCHMKYDQENTDAETADAFDHLKSSYRR